MYFFLVVKCISGNGFPTEDKNKNDGVKEKTSNFRLSTELVKYFPGVTEKRQETWISIKCFRSSNFLLCLQNKARYDDIRGNQILWKF